MNITELSKKGYKLLPYITPEQAFLEFVSQSRNYKSNGKSTVFHNGREDPNTGLKPRELFCLSVVANVAKFLSGDEWVPGALVNPDGTIPAGNIAHDGFIKCIKGNKLGKFMWFEQVMATDRAKNATPNNIEEAILNEAQRKAQNGTDYGVDDMGLIIFVDYNGELSDLRELSSRMQQVAYRVVYLIAVISKDMKNCVCVILKSPGDTLGPIKVSFTNSNGSAELSRLRSY